MDWILIVRTVIFVTFLLLVIEGVVALAWAKRFTSLYVRAHKELEVRVETLERRTHLE